METFYQSLDVLLFNSDWDAMPTTPLEAMSHGVPVVASLLNGGLKEILASPEGGFLLNRHDPEALAAAVADLLQNPAAAAKVSRAAREHVRIASDPETIAIQHEELWRQ